MRSTAIGWGSGLLPAHGEAAGPGAQRCGEAPGHTPIQEPLAEPAPAWRPCNAEHVTAEDDLIVNQAAIVNQAFETPTSAKPLSSWPAARGYRFTQGRARWL
eukprot:3253437-Prymnesium_polylepis.2